MGLNRLGSSVILGTRQSIKMLLLSVLESQSLKKMKIKVFNSLHLLEKCLILQLNQKRRAIKMVLLLVLESQSED